jgi:hypothetical protein
MKFRLRLTNPPKSYFQTYFIKIATKIQQQSVTNQEKFKNGFRFFVKVSVCKISALKLFPVAQNLVTNSGFWTFL